jgi:hypothetical protein
MHKPQEFNTPRQSESYFVTSVSFTPKIALSYFCALPGMNSHEVFIVSTLQTAPVVMLASTFRLFVKETKNCGNERILFSPLDILIWSETPFADKYPLFMKS